jgi:hypothetical protein
MQQLGYFGSGVGRVPGAEDVPEPEGELVVFEVVGDLFSNAMNQEQGNIKC